MSATTAHRPTSVSFAPSPIDNLRQSTLRKNMSITQTYYLAHKARAKLSREAAQADHDLRLLVGHANLLDNLMLELADAEREQERWFNQSVRGAEQKQQPAPHKAERHVQWAETVAEVPEEDEYESDSSSDSSDEEDVDDVVMTTALPAPVLRSYAGEDMEEDDLEEDYAQLELVRTPSHSNSPPELLDDSDSSDDESMPPSPNQDALPLHEDEKEAGKDTESEQSLFASEEEEEGYYLPQRTPTSMVSAISVY